MDAVTTDRDRLLKQIEAARPRLTANGGADPDFIDDRRARCGWLRPGGPLCRADNLSGQVQVHPVALPASGQLGEGAVHALRRLAGDSQREGLGNRLR